MAKWVAHLLMLASLLMPALRLVSQQHAEAHIHNSDVATPPRFVHTHHDLCGLEDLTDCKHLAHYRFITEIQTVEVFTTDGEAFGGNLVSFARLLRQGKEYVEGQKVYA